MSVEVDLQIEDQTFQLGQVAAVVQKQAIPGTDLLGWVEDLLQQFGGAEAARHDAA